VVPLMIQGHQLMPCLVLFPSQVRDSKTRQVQNGPSSQWISPQDKGATSTIDNRPITQFPPRSAFLPGNRQSQLPIFCDQPTQHRGPIPIRPSLLRCARFGALPQMGSSHRSTPTTSSDLPPLFPPPPHLSNLVVDENLPPQGRLHTQSCSSIPSTIPSASSAPFSNCTIIILL
jgi:hypothetical protein